MNPETCAPSGNRFTSSDDPDPACAPEPDPQEQFSASCSDWGCMPAAYSRAIGALTLNPQCMDLFGTAKSRANGWNPAAVLTDIIYGTHKHGTIQFADWGPNGDMAKTTPSRRGIGLVTGRVTININKDTDTTGT